MNLEHIQRKIYEIRGFKVILDFDLAYMYGGCLISLLPQRTLCFYAKDAKRKLLKIKSLRSLRKIFAHLAVNVF